jgi:hypothetical protein
MITPLCDCGPAVVKRDWIADFGLKNDFKKSMSSLLFSITDALARSQKVYKLE